MLGARSVAWDNLQLCKSYCGLCMLIDDWTTLYCLHVLHDLSWESHIMAKAGVYALECFLNILEFSRTSYWWAREREMQQNYAFSRISQDLKTLY